MRNANKTAKYKVIQKGYKTQRERSNDSISPTVKIKSFKKKKKCKVSTKEIKPQEITVQIVKRDSVSKTRNATKTSRDLSMTKKTSNFLSNLMSKIKTDKGVKGNKSRAHSTSEFRGVIQYPKTERTNYQSFKRSISGNRKDTKLLKKCSNRHKKNTKTLGAHTQFPAADKLSRNNTHVTLRQFQSNLLNPLKSTKTKEKQVPKTKVAK